MKLTKAQQIDIDLCKYFYPCEPTEQEIEEYLDLSERGEGKERGKFATNPLVIGKTRRGVTMEMWEDGIMDVPYVTLLGGYGGSIQRRWWNPMRWIDEELFFFHQPIPRYVVDFMKKEMFQGADADLIEECYQTLK